MYLNMYQCISIYVYIHIYTFICMNMCPYINVFLAIVCTCVYACPLRTCEAHSHKNIFFKLEQTLRTINTIMQCWLPMLQYSIPFLFIFKVDSIICASNVGKGLNLLYCFTTKNPNSVSSWQSDCDFSILGWCVCISYLTSIGKVLTVVCVFSCVRVCMFSCIRACMHVCVCV